MPPKMFFPLLLVAVGTTLSLPIVIDGDTLRDGDVRYRVENIDAPERGWRAECPSERVLAERARDYVLNWVAHARQVEALPVGRRDRYGRVVARIHIDGVDLGERLMARGLAQPWRGHKAAPALGSDRTRASAVPVASVGSTCPNARRLPPQLH